jgi:hypothetical protein
MKKTLYFLVLLAMCVVCSTTPKEVRYNISEWSKLISKKTEEITQLEDDYELSGK